MIPYRICQFQLDMQFILNISEVVLIVINCCIFSREWLSIGKPGMSKSKVHDFR